MTEAITGNDPELESVWRLWAYAIGSTPPLLDFDEVNRRFGIPKSRVVELAAMGEIKIVRLGARSMVSTASLFKMIDRLPLAHVKVPSLVAARQRSNARRAAKEAREAGSTATATAT